MHKMKRNIITQFNHVMLVEGIRKWICFVTLSLSQAINHDTDA